MIDSIAVPQKEIFTYHYFFPKKGIRIRYGITCPDETPSAIFLILHGRSEFIEKYRTIAQTLQDKGFWIVSPDWRGQGLSSRELENRHKGHIDRFEDYVNDLEALFTDIILPKDLPVYILSHSMGGHIALRFMAQHPEKIKKAVLASPMIDIALPSIIKPISRFISKQLSKTGFARAYTIGSTGYSAEKAAFEGNNLTHDPEKYWILHNEIHQNPELALGGVTWGWLNAAFESIQQLEKETVIQKIVTPILMASAQKDVIVSPNAQRKLSRKLPDCTFLPVDGAFHELLFEESKMSAVFWKAFDQFIEQ